MIINWEYIAITSKNSQYFLLVLETIIEKLKNYLQFTESTLGIAPCFHLV
jgi:hypothetical protein